MKSQQRVREAGSFPRQKRLYSASMRRTIFVEDARYLITFFIWFMCALPVVIAIFDLLHQDVRYVWVKVVALVALLFYSKYLMMRLHVVQMTKPA
jgi:hypothetical protein